MFYFSLASFGENREEQLHCFLTMKTPTKTPISSAMPPSIHRLRASRALLPSAAASSPKILAKQSCRHSGGNKEGQSSRLQQLQTWLHNQQGSWLGKTPATVSSALSLSSNKMSASRNAGAPTEETPYWCGRRRTEAAGQIALIYPAWSLSGQIGNIWEDTAPRRGHGHKDLNHKNTANSQFVLVTEGKTDTSF